MLDLNVEWRTYLIVYSMMSHFSIFGKNKKGGGRVIRMAHSTDDDKSLVSLR